MKPTLVLSPTLTLFYGEEFVLRVPKGISYLTHKVEEFRVVVTTDSQSKFYKAETKGINVSG